MTTQSQLPATDPDEKTRCTDPVTLRELARGKRGEKALLDLRAMTLGREADQLEHEAGLWEMAEAAEAVWQALRQKTVGLEAAAEGTLAAEREAEDMLRDDKRHLAHRKGEATRAESSGTREAQDEAAVRLHKSGQRVAEAEKELAAAREKHKAAEAALDSHRGAVREAEAAWKRTLDAGYNPGVAPRKSPLRPGIGRVEDMTEEERNYAALLAITMGAVGTGGSGREQPTRNRRTTNGEFAAQDPAKFRMIRHGDHMIAVPPARQ